MPKKPLDFFQVINAYRRPRGKEYGEQLRHIHPAEFEGSHAPQGTYSTYPKGLILPKKKRGDKIVVDFTVAQRKEF